MVTSILDPMSAEARRATLKRGRFLFELLMAVCVPLAGAVVIIFVGDLMLKRPVSGRLIISAVAGTIVGMPLAIYFTLRLNAAIIARERSALPLEPEIYAPFSGPLLFRRTFVSGTRRSRFSASLPATVTMAATVLALGYVFSSEVGPSGLAYAMMPATPMFIVSLLQLVPLLMLLGRRDRPSDPVEVTP